MPSPLRPRIGNGAIVMERDGVAYEVVIAPTSGTVLVYGGTASDIYETHWPERLEHPWMWGKPIGVVVELAVERSHRRHLRTMARLRDTEELKRQLAAREAERRDGA